MLMIFPHQCIFWQSLSWKFISLGTNVSDFSMLITGLALKQKIKYYKIIPFYYRTSQFCRI